MLYSHKDLKEKGLSNYQIEKKVKEQELFKLQKGLYSTTSDVSLLDMVVKLHPNVIITLESACFCYGLLKKEPSKVSVATIQNARKIKEPFVKQTFMTTRLFLYGMRKVTYKGTLIAIYDLERLLVEVARNKVYIAYDDYQEIMESYKNLVKLLNRKKIETYLNFFKDKRIEKRIEALWL